LRRQFLYLSLGLAGKQDVDRPGWQLLVAREAALQPFELHIEDEWRFLPGEQGKPAGAAVGQHATQFARLDDQGRVFATFAEYRLRRHSLWLLDTHFQTVAWLALQRVGEGLVD
jgi:hypothetical protein